MASDLMNVGAAGKYYKVQPNGKAQSGLEVGDRVVTSGGTYQILDINKDGIVDNQDASHLARCLARWDGYELN